MSRTKSEQIAFENNFEDRYIIENKRFTCRKCDQLIRSSYEKHYESCIGWGTRREPNKESPLVNNELYSKVCNMGCGQESKFFYKSGKAYCCKFGNTCPTKIQTDSDKKKGINPWEGKEHPRGMLGKASWNAGLTKETNELVAALAKKSSIFRTQYNKTHKYNHSDAAKAKLSAAAFRRGIGGHKIGAGGGKKGIYKGIFCDSSWELAYVIYCLEHNIAIRRNTDYLPYTWKGKQRKYYFDFIVTYTDGKEEKIEIKGYWSKNFCEKIKHYSYIKVFHIKEMKPIFEYVVGKYGKKFIELYEKKSEII